MNFMPGNQGYLSNVADAVKNLGVVLGGPDVRPDDPPLVARVYPIMQSFIGKMKMFGQVEPSCYRWPRHDLTVDWPTPFWTMPELFDFARDRKNGLGVDYMFWTRVTKSGPQTYDWFDALKVMEQYPTRSSW
jgi:hypothetical protein